MKRKPTSEFLIDGMPMLMPDAGVNIKCVDRESGSTGTDESGIMHRFLTRTNVKTWEFTYALLTAKEYAYVKALLQGKPNFQFTFRNEDGEKETVAAYSKETSVSYWSRRRELYKNLQFAIIQC